MLCTFPLLTSAKEEYFPIKNNVITPCKSHFELFYQLNNFNQRDIKLNIGTIHLRTFLNESLDSEMDNILTLAEPAAGFSDLQQRSISRFKVITSP